MTTALRAYGAAAAKQIIGTGAAVDVWDLGNEVEFGVAGVAVRPLPGGCDASAGAAGAYEAPDGIDRAIGQMSVSTLARMDASHRIAWLREHLWPYEAKLFAAVADGIRSVDPGARFSTHVSCSTGTDRSPRHGRRWMRSWRGESTAIPSGPRPLVDQSTTPAR